MDIDEQKISALLAPAKITLFQVIPAPCKHIHRPQLFFIVFFNPSVSLEFYMIYHNKVLHKLKLKENVT